MTQVIVVREAVRASSSTGSTGAWPGTRSVTTADPVPNIVTAMSSDGTKAFWLAWLRIATVFMIAFGLFLVIAPALSRQGFSLMVYSSADRIGGFGPAAADYIELAHAVMGAVMVGWGVALLMVLRGPMQRNVREGALIYAVSLGCWFVPDTIFSLASGFWQNAILNTGFALLFGIPLVACFARRGCARATRCDLRLGESATWPLASTTSRRSYPPAMNGTVVEGQSIESVEVQADRAK